MIYFIIEHPTRGVLQNSYEIADLRFPFSWSKPRSDEGNARFENITAAMFVLRQMARANGTMTSVAGKCAVRRSTPDKETGTFWPVVDTWPPTGFKS